MLLPKITTIHLYASPTDMRKGFYSLTGLARSAFGVDPRRGSLFLFVNRRKTSVKLLFYQSDGPVIWMKRLEKGVFNISFSKEGHARQISLEGLASILYKP